ncbi:MAG: hypothetical protein IPM47_14700 [Sphingobacteriales bacterium]|nr:MAG: hypothetical protein IPM47_14700 [Sphingobacteriales bacterium]
MSKTIEKSEEEIALEGLENMSFSDNIVIEKIQILLYLHGYKPGKTDGILKQQTEEALNSFQSDYQLMIGDRSIKTLESLGVHWFDFSVEDIQQKLFQKGYDPGPIDNIIGPMTRNAYLDFLKNNQFKQSDIINAEIKKALFSDDPKYILQTGEGTQISEEDLSDKISQTYPFITGITISKASIRDVQQALNAKGYDAGPYTQVSTPQFKDALFQFQVDKQLPMGGMNVETLRALGFKED